MWMRKQHSIRCFGAFNTLLLLSRSWFVALAVHAARRSMRVSSKRFFALAFLCGLGFVVIKYFEWGEKIGAGLTLETNDFFMYYYLFTGIHLLHVMIGLGVLAFLWNVAHVSELNESDVNSLESGASFWHLVDILLDRVIRAFLSYAVIHWRPLIIQRITAVWLVLILATGLSWQFGHGMGFGENYQYATAAILIITSIKIRLVFLDFMELRNAPFALRAAFEVWAVLACLGLIGLYWLGVI